MMTGRNLKRGMGQVADLGRQLLVLAAIPAVIGLMTLLEPGPIPGDKRTPSLAHDGSAHAATCPTCQWCLREEAARRAARAVAAMGDATDAQVEQTLDRLPAAASARPSVVPALDRLEAGRAEDCSSL
jgi:hypothetical protein